jgi:transposase
MQDNDPKHTSKKAKEWLRVQNVRVLSWPANSPDLNPIENLWRYLEMKLRERKTRFSNKDDLWEILQEEWYKIDLEIIKKLYISILRRINECIGKKGSHTSY